MTTITQLPNEILWQIGNHFDTLDLIELACVSSFCNRVFRPQRYRTVEINTKTQLTMFTKTLEDSVKKRRRRKSDVPDTPYVGVLGECVRSLVLQDGMLTIKGMEKVAKLCPRVTTMDFTWSDSLTPNGNHKPLTRIFHSPVPFFDHFDLPSLTSLSLKGKFPIDPMITLAPVLCRLPRLTHLKITSSFKMTMANMEEIHALCPRLQHLLFTKPMLLDIDDMSISPEEMESLVPASPLQNLSLPSEIWAHQNITYTLLFKFITRKYPELKSLDISSGSQTVNYIDNEGKPFIGSVQTLTLRQHFQHLENLRLGEFGGQPSTALPLLFRGIRKVTLDDERVSTNFSRWVRHGATNRIERLHLSTVPQRLGDLHYCTRLQELSLGSILNFKLQCLQQLPIDTVIGGCPSLIKLTITGYTIVHKSNAKSTSILNTLILRKSAFEDNNVLMRIGTRCPRLTHLDLYSCRWYSPREYPVIRITMPQQSLRFLRILKPEMYTRPNPIGTNFLYGAYRESQAKRMNECLLVKTSSHTHPLFWTAQKPFSSDSVVTRISNPAILDWLDRVEANCGRKTPKSTLRRKVAIRALETLRASADLEGHTPSKMKDYRFGSTVIRCSKVDRFYYDDIRLDFENSDFRRQKPIGLDHRNCHINPL
ncbi:hypothetical protein BJV82DRAFT_618239 [Fennellomyces sp. T-0311]|nr:hypothetical protein BJV82DRAFT_618239 [Fennellomyces sp. T-0311]